MHFCSLLLFFVGGPQDVPLLFLYALDLPAHMQLLAKVSCKNLCGAEANRWKVLWRFQKLPIFCNYPT